MNVEFFVHGVPNGEDFWGKEEERSFFGTFYDNSSDKQKFVIQARGQHFYYSYLVYDSVKAYDGRDGSYFGMTLRMDAYCHEFMQMYHILDIAFNSYVMGKLLVNDRSRLKYTVPSFANNDIRSINEKVFVLLNGILSNGSFSRIGSVISASGQCPKRNLYDCTKESVVADIRQYGKIAISPYYPNVRESSAQQQYDARIAEMRQQCETQINQNSAAYAQREQAANATISSLQNKITQLSNSIQQKDARIGMLQGQIEQLNSTLAQERQNLNIARLIEQIKEPVASLSAILNSQNQRKEDYIKPNQTHVEPNEPQTPPIPANLRYLGIGGVIGHLLLIVLMCWFKFSFFMLLFGIGIFAVDMIVLAVYIFSGKEKSHGENDSAEHKKPHKSKHIKQGYC